MTSENALVLQFAVIRASDTSVVGGKAANLGELTAAGFPVPSGFCLTTLAFRRFIDSCTQDGDLFASLSRSENLDLDEIRATGQDIRSRLLAAPVPLEVEDAVLRSWHSAGTDDSYAVRSSATAEDLPTASFAGQQDTFLNVHGQDALFGAIRRCWVSLFTDRAILYRRRNGFSHVDVQLSVVIQQMISSDISGILFTADPLTGHRHTLTIDASYGLGEALVSGLVSPDFYRVDKRTGEITEQRIGEKKVAIIPDEAGGTRQIDLDPEQRTGTVLSEQQIARLAELGVQIESHNGSPQDIEWAIAGGKIWLLQARPITSLYPIESIASPRDGLHVYFSMGHQQNMTAAMSPLSMNTLQMVIPIGRTADGTDNRFLRPVGGHPYIDLTKVLRHPLLSKGIVGGISQFSALAPESIKMAIARPEFRRRHGTRFSFAAMKNLGQFVLRILRALWLQDLVGFLPRTNRAIRFYLERVTADLRSTPVGPTQIRTIVATVGTLYQPVLGWAPHFVAGEISKRLMTRMARNLITPQETEALSLGIPGNVVNEMNLAISDLADVASRAAKLRDFFSTLGEAESGHRWIENAAAVEGSAPFLEAWKAFLDTYGARGPSEIEFTAPSWDEEPLPVLRVIAAQLNNSHGGHRRRHARMVEERGEATRKMLERAHGPKRRVLKRLVYVLTNVGGLREHHKFLAVNVFRIIKAHLTQTGSALVEMGRLNRLDDIWFLTWSELQTIWDDDRTDWPGLARERREQMVRYDKLDPPLVLTSDGDTPLAQYESPNEGDGTLVGSPVSTGVVEGIVRVIRDPQTEDLVPGEILVASFTDPGWTPLFLNAGGLVMEIGGIMTHGSVVAREYGIPAVVGVRDATKALETGQRVRVDGNRGIVEILSDGPNRAPDNQGISND